MSIRPNKTVGGTRRDIGERTFQFGVRIVKMVRQLPKEYASQVVVRQLARSGLSVGANVEEAQASLSRADFARRLNIALSEARETHYWLRTVKETGLAQSQRLELVLGEANELVSILTAIVKKCRSTDERKSGKLRSSFQGFFYILNSSFSIRSPGDDNGRNENR